METASLLNQATYERLYALCGPLDVFLQKYFKDMDLTPPPNPAETALDFLMKAENLIYEVDLVYQPHMNDDDTVALIWFKDRALKTLVVLTHLPFFTEVLGEEGFLEPAVSLCQKVTTEMFQYAFKVRQRVENMDSLPDPKSRTATGWTMAEKAEEEDPQPQQPEESNSVN